MNCEILHRLEKWDIGQCASEDAGPSKGVNCEISHRLKKGDTG